MALEWTKESIDALTGQTEMPFIVRNPIYDNKQGPVNIKVIDPLNVKKADYKLKFIVGSEGVSKAKWVLYEIENGSEVLVDTSFVDISVDNEQLILDRGISIQINQAKNPGDPEALNNGYITSSMTFADSSMIWLYGVPDIDNPGPLNWIRSGVLDDSDVPDNNDWNMPDNPWDPEEDFEKMVSRLWSPYNLVALGSQDGGTGPGYSYPSKFQYRASQLSSVNIVLTSDKSKWTRCPVIEMCPDKSLAEGGKERFDVRSAPSVDKFGNKANPNDPASTNPDDPNFISATGMGWFPGYAYNLETGERLNLMFGEDSWLVSENGRDMLFNPTTAFFSQLGRPIFGGKHYIYVMSHNYNIEPGFPELDGPAYDFGSWGRNILADPNLRLYGYLNSMYVNIPMALENQEWLSCDVTIRIRVSKPYAQNYSPPDVGNPTPANRH